MTDSYNVTDYPEINTITPNVWYLDGHDHQRITKKPCFKRELFLQQESVYPTGFGIPRHQIRPLNFTNKIQAIQKTVPPYAVFGPQILGGDTKRLYCFSDEEDYYKDMGHSWFGLTCKKGGWDSLRHYEILASGACLMFRDYDKKPPLCAPQDLPCFSYSTLDELESIINRLLINEKPTDEYYDMVLRQREWLIKYELEVDDEYKGETTHTLNVTMSEEEEVDIPLIDVTTSTKYDGQTGEPLDETETIEVVSTQSPADNETLNLRLEILKVLESILAILFGR